MQTGSGLSSSRLPSVITGVALVLALVGVGGIAIGAADEPSDDLKTSTGTTIGGDGGDAPTGASTTLAGGASTTAAAGASTTAKPTGTTAKPTATTATSAACPVAPAATADPGAQQPIPIGTFTYASCSDASKTSDMKVAAGPSGGGVTRRNVSEEASGFAQTATLAYGGSGVLLESLTVQTPQGPVTCDWNPDVLNYPNGLTLGREWTAKSSCPLKGSKGVKMGDLTLDAKGKVSGKVQVNVGGTNVNAWVIDATITLTTKTSFGDQTVTVVSKDHYDPTRGLDLFRHSEAKSGQETMVRDERLTSLTPKP